MRVGWTIYPDNLRTFSTAADSLNRSDHCRPLADGDGGGLEVIAWVRGWLSVATTVALLLILEHRTRLSLVKLLFLCIPTPAGTSLAVAATQSLNLSNSHHFVQFFFLGTYTLQLLRSASALWVCSCLKVRTNGDSCAICSVKPVEDNSPERTIEQIKDGLEFTFLPC